MTPEELDAIRERWAARDGDPRFTYQSGCAGSPARNGAMHRGPCGEGLHHHHDDRCAPSPNEDVLALLAEIDRLQLPAETWWRFSESVQEGLKRAQDEGRVVELDGESKRNAALQQELDRLRPKAEAWERLESELRRMQEIAGTPVTDRVPAGTISALGINADPDRETLARMEAPIQRFVSRELMEAMEAPEDAWRSDRIGPNPDYAPATCQCYQCRKDRGELATPQEGE